MGNILNHLAEETKTGVSPLRLDALAEGLILKSGGKPAFKNYKTKDSPIPFPATLCVSANEEIVHGIPDDLPFCEGEIIKLDIGMRWPAKRGLITDTALTVAVGKVGLEADRLIRATREALALGIGEVKDGARIGDIGAVIESYLKKNKIGIVRNLAGHGVGYDLHEDPVIPNYGHKGSGPEIKKGMVLAVEIMTTLGDGRIKSSPDGWTLKSADGTLGAHFEHTVVVTGRGAEVLTGPDTF